MKHSSDIIIIGAGVIGLASALELKKEFPQKHIAILERGKQVFSETSRYNSAVIHSGIHQDPSFFRSKLAHEGAPRLLAFCRQEGVVVKKRGMLLAVAPRTLKELFQEAIALWLLYRNGRRQKIPMKFLTKRAIKKLEPKVRAYLGIYLSEVWVIDLVGLGKKLRQKAETIGVEIICEQEVYVLAQAGNVYRVRAGKNEYTARTVINSAGVRADSISQLAGFKTPEVFPYRGEYYEVIGEKRNLIQSTLMYPALRPSSPVKGIHLTKTYEGRLLIGPNGKQWGKKSDDFTVQTPPEEFLKAAQKFLPQLTKKDIQWAFSGLRAKIDYAEGEEDFIIRSEQKNPGFINLIGIESPGLTAAFGIAKYVARLVKEHKSYEMVDE